MIRSKVSSVLEQYLPQSHAWLDGYQAFMKLMGKPLGWLYLVEADRFRLVRLDRKGNCSFFAGSKNNENACSSFLEKYLDQLKQKPDEVHTLPKFYHCAYGRAGAIFSLKHLGQLKGFLVLCAIHAPQRAVKPYLKVFEQFVQSHVELAYRSFELQNFYETVHPRALALSTIHSVHRVMASSLRMQQLLPRIGRLCAQVCKAKSCAVYLLDPERKHLIPKFSFGERSKRKRRIRVGFGLEGRVADTAEFHISKQCLAVPFIEEDVVGVIVLRNKISASPFTQTDLEILKTLSEQAVVAIKNAQLFEETEELTLSSIKTINELLQLNVSKESQLLHLFSELTFQVGREMGLHASELTSLHRATLLIDTGLLGTPPQILEKKDKLTRKEYEEIKRHPSRGASALKHISSLHPVIPIIEHHHERYDGKGYPDRLAGDEIPMGARVVAVVDAFIAMISERPHRVTLNLETAIHEIKSNSGSQFDPRVVECFLKVISRPETVEIIKHAIESSVDGSRNKKKA
jgi:GAF domain-containing protein